MKYIDILCKKVNESFLIVKEQNATLKSVLRGQHWDKEKWLYMTGDLLKEVQLYEIFHDKTRKGGH